MRQTLTRWSRADLDRAAPRALAYLPAKTPIHATVYPAIKPRQNSFAFETDKDPAIFLALDPEVSAAQLENIVGHELHHVGFAGACPAAPADTPAGTAWRWIGAFGEGIAMLAAAGGPDVHPHAVSAPADRERWDGDLAKVPADGAAVDAFLRSVADGSLAGDAATEKARTFYGVQGPWYTVGYHLAVTIERAAGRQALVAAVCDGAPVLPELQVARVATARNLADSTRSNLLELTPARELYPPS